MKFALPHFLHLFIFSSTILSSSPNSGCWTPSRVSEPHLCTVVFLFTPSAGDILSGADLHLLIMCVVGQDFVNDLLWFSLKNKTN